MVAILIADKGIEHEVSDEHVAAATNVRRSRPAWRHLELQRDRHHPPERVLLGLETLSGVVFLDEGPEDFVPVHESAVVRYERWRDHATLLPPDRQVVL